MKNQLYKHENTPHIPYLYARNSLVEEKNIKKNYTMYLKDKMKGESNL
jgi:hypothetical protein